MLRIRHLLNGVALAAGLAPAAFAQSGYPQSAYPQSTYPQTYAQPGYATPLPPASDADQLAQQLRLLATNPTDLYALIAAAKLSLKVGDTDAAAALYTRAEHVSPQNPQVKAGIARLLVQAGRPGEALRRFQEAQYAGASLADFGSDRALAYDLIGQQDRAQREYRSLLRLDPDDETTRRYALSLGITGLKEPALALLEPLNRRSDRGAWRARAFVLAMNGDRRGAEQIATTMMPAGMAEGLAPFFDRLPRLSAIDRAFAVNFGEMRASPTRLADARLVPPLPALAPEPNPFPAATRGAAVQLAAEDQEDRGRKRKKSKRDRAEVQRVAAVQSYEVPLPPPPAPTAAQLASLSSSRMPSRFNSYAAATGRVTVLPPPADAYRPVTRVASATPAPATDDSGDEPDFAVNAVSAVAAGKAPTLPADDTQSVVDRAVARPPAVAATLPSGQPLTFAGVPSAQVSTFALTTQTPVAGTSPPVQSALAPPVLTALAPPVLTAAATTAAATQPVASPPVAVAAITPATGAPPPPKGETGDAVLAAIVAGIQVPDSERAEPAVAAPARLLTNVEKQETRAALAVTPATRTQPGAKLALDPAQLRKDGRGRFVDSQNRPLLDGKGQPMDAKAAIAWLGMRDPNYVPLAAKAEAAELPRKDARGRFVDARGKPLLDARGRPLTEKAAAALAATQATDEKASAKGKADATLPKKDARGRFVDAKGKPLLDPRGRPMDAKQATAWLAAGGKTPAEKKDAPEKAEPQRYWVQVAGGANEATLGKEWTRVQGQAASLRGKQGWTTPLRATNRVLTGPYKSSAEAMTAVNQLKKEGVAAFMFTSDPGQKVTRLGGK